LSFSYLELFKWVYAEEIMIHFEVNTKQSAISDVTSKWDVYTKFFTDFYGLSSSEEDSSYKKRKKKEKKKNFN